MTQMKTPLLVLAPLALVPLSAPLAQQMMNMPGMAPMAMTQPMTGALSSATPMTREASGTSWQPDASPHQGIETMAGPWMLMGHALLNGVYDWQGGPRGGREAFASGMVMGMAKRDFDDGDTLQFRAMYSPEPLMGPAGYPLLLASGETANGHTPLIDRQHPHNLVMEQSATYGHVLSADDGLFLYAGLPGEPAFGPPAFMHRLSIMDSPEAPISHHWLDSMHITNGVVTAGWVHDDWKLELSQFHGREPDQDRYAIEPGALDSTAARLSWNPDAHWSLQTSWAHQVSPEQLQPTENDERVSVSAIYTVPLGGGGWWSSTAAWGRRQSGNGPWLDAYVLESAIKPGEPWTIFGRFENTATDELTQNALNGPVEMVAKFSVGAIHDWKLGAHAKIGLGALYAFNFVPDALVASYGSADPKGAMGFVRLKFE